MTANLGGCVGQCIYCGKNAPLTRDHIPPACLFASPRPANLITVPSCLCCNKGASKDDEYFRMVYCGRLDTSRHPDVRTNLQGILRSLDRPESAGLSRSFFGTFREVSVFSREGSYLGEAGAFSVDVPRIERVARRIFKGIFYHVQKHRLPDDYEVHIVVLHKEWQTVDADAKAVLCRMVSGVVAAREQVIGDRVFSYWFRAVEDNENACAALFRFYGIVDTEMLAFSLRGEDGPACTRETKSVEV